MRSPTIPPFLAGALAFVAYLTTMNSTVTFIDSGELAAVASTLGIAHPTGYPLFSLLGRLVTLLPFGAEEIYRLNLMSAFLVGASVVIFARLIHVLESVPLVFPPMQRRKISLPRYVNRATSVGASLSFAFVSTVWAQSVAVEVYALHLFFLVMILYLFVKGIAAQLASDRSTSRELLLGAYVLGLSFSNHLTTILLVPGLVMLYFITLGTNRDSRVRLIRMLSLSILGLTTYLYLPIRSLARPPLDWGYTNEVGRLIWHVSGKQYRSWIFSGFETAKKQAIYFVGNLSYEFHLLVLVCAVVGFIVILYRIPRLSIVLAALFLTCVGYAINYDIHDIDSYFLLAYVVMSITVVYGMRWILEYVHRKRPRLLAASVVLLVIGLPATQFLANGTRVSESDNSMVRDYTVNILDNLGTDALVLSYQWDYFVSAALYYQHVRGHRPDVTIVDKELLRRSWYFKQLENNSPWLIRQSRGEIESFLRELHKFEHDLPYNPHVIESQFTQMINHIIDKSMETRPVYLGPEIEEHLGAKYERVPDGLLLRLVRRGEKGKFRLRNWPNVRPASISGKMTTGLMRRYSIMAALTAEEFQRQGDYKRSKEWAERALGYDPGLVPARRILERAVSHQDSLEAPSD